MSAPVIPQPLSLTSIRTTTFSSTGGRACRASCRARWFALNTSCSSRASSSVPPELVVPAALGCDETVRVAMSGGRAAGTPPCVGDSMGGMYPGGGLPEAGLPGVTVGVSGPALGVSPGSFDEPCGLKKLGIRVGHSRRVVMVTRPPEGVNLHAFLCGI
jgi:hypothetical protein